MTRTVRPMARQRATHYEVSCLPEDHPDYDQFVVEVEYRRAERLWAVRSRGRYLGADYTWSWGFRWPSAGAEREPSTEEEFRALEEARGRWLAEHRFPEKEALRMACEAAPGMEIGPRSRPYSVSDALRRHTAEE